MKQMSCIRTHRITALVHISVLLLIQVWITLLLRENRKSGASQIYWFSFLVALVRLAFKEESTSYVALN